MFISCFGILILLASMAEAQEMKLPTKEVQAVAAPSLQTFAHLVTKDNYRQMGFETPSDVGKATLDSPLIDFMVQLDQLKKYASGNKPEDLLAATGDIYFPVLVNGQVRSTITLAKVKDVWQAVSFGSSDFMTLVSTTLRENAKRTGLPYAAHFVVRVPALSLFFLGYRADNQLMLVPLLDNAKLGFQAGVAMKADEAFTAVLPEAREHDGLPR